MSVQGLRKKIIAVSCVLLFAAFCQSNTNGQSRDKAQPIDWGRALDLSPKNTETKPERLDTRRELELGRQLRDQNDRARAQLEGRQDSRTSGPSAAVSAPNIEMRGVFERDTRDRSNGSDRNSSRDETSQGYVPRARPDLIGSPYYYNARRIDLTWNNPGVTDPYYAKGAKYYDRYVNQVSPTLTPAGQGFVSRVGAAIERMIDNAITSNPRGYARLERDPIAFNRFMADVHTRAYFESGWANLPTSDQWKIVHAIDLRDFGSDARQTTRELVPGLFGYTPQEYTRPMPQYGPCTCAQRRR